MSRNKGTFNFAANFEVLKKAPLDARLVVNLKDDLINPSTWIDADSNAWLYNGLVVSVAADTSDNKGLYFLLNEADYTDINNWLKINFIGPTDVSGTTSVTFQLNTGENGVVLKDSSGNLEVVTFDGSTYANIKAGHLDIDSIRLDTLNGALYVQDGSIYSVSTSYPLLAYEGILTGNGVTSNFPIIHDLSTFRQSVSIWDKSTNEMIYPEIQRGASTNYISFLSPPLGGVDYTIIILGF